MRATSTRCRSAPSLGLPERSASSCGADGTMPNFLEIDTIASNTDYSRRQRACLGTVLAALIIYGDVSSKLPKNR